MNALKPSDITVRRNLLLISGESLTLDETSPDKLGEVLELGRTAIIGEIEAFYYRTKEANPDATIVRPSIFSLLVSQDIGTKAQDAEFLSLYGLANQTNIHRQKIEIKHRLEPYWEVTETAGFMPEIRNRVGGKVKSMWLSLRNPETDPAPLGGLDNLPQALGFLEPGKAADLKPVMREAWESNDESSYRNLLSKYQELGEERVDQEAGVPGEAPRELKQIGLIVATANTRLAIQGLESAKSDYSEAIRDAEEYAYQMQYDELSSVLKTEVNRISPGTI